MTYILILSAVVIAAFISLMIYARMDDAHQGDEEVYTQEDEDRYENWL